MDGLPLSSGVNIPGKPERISNEENQELLQRKRIFTKSQERCIVVKYLPGSRQVSKNPKTHNDRGGGKFTLSME